MLRTALFALGALVALIIVFLIWRIVATVRATRRRTAAIMDRLEPVVGPIRAGETPDQREIEQLAGVHELRNMLYETLRALDRDALFPGRHRDPEAIAVSDLAMWLCHANELGSAPDEIELVIRSTRDSGTPLGAVDYYVFRYRKGPPHWAASDGWMLGVAGPYVNGQRSDVPAPATFSTFKSENATTPDEHVDFCHRMMGSHGYHSMINETDAD